MVLQIYELPQGLIWDDVEVHPVARLEDGSCEVVDEGEHSFWSVYVHLVEGGVQCVADLFSKKQALTFADFLRILYRQMPVSNPSFFSSSSANLEFNPTSGNIFASSGVNCSAAPGVPSAYNLAIGTSNVGIGHFAGTSSRPEGISIESIEEAREQVLGTIRRYEEASADVERERLLDPIRPLYPIDWPDSDLSRSLDFLLPSQDSPVSDGGIYSQNEQQDATDF